jgi:hypothetical protein
VPISELGLVFNVFPVAVAGLLLFCGCVAGMLQESGYVEVPWPALGVMALLLFGFGAAVLYVNPQVGVDLTLRAYAMIATGAILVSAVVAGKLFVPKGQYSS